MCDRNLKATVQHLSDRLEQASDRIRELEAEVMGQQLAVNQCMFVLALESEDRREKLLEALDGLHAKVVGGAHDPETDVVTAGSLVAAASTVDELRNVLQGQDVGLKIINGGRKDEPHRD